MFGGNLSMRHCEEEATIERIPPFASILAKGPLGVAHLPRMWSKALLHATGRLAEGYRTGCYFDRTLMTSLGIDTDKALSYIAAERPTYLAFETWVLREAGGDISEEKIAEINAKILGHELDAAERQSFQEELGLPPDSPVRNTAELEQLDDWVQFHSILL